MRRAIISDVHGNLEALLAVIDDITALEIEEVYCLGDIVGYGPDPRECLDICMNCDKVILGNHDQATLVDPPHFSPSALRAILWTREVLEADHSTEGTARWDFLGSLPRYHREEDVLYVHGSALNPTEQYVFPDDVRNPRKMELIFQAVPLYSFQGHTHVPGVFTEEPTFMAPPALGFRYVLDGRKAMINVGSVGQPRDRDPRACYVVFDGESVEFRRVPYDPRLTRDKIYRVPDLDNFLGDRLLSAQ